MSLLMIQYEPIKANDSSVVVTKEPKISLSPKTARVTAKIALKKFAFIHSGEWILFLLLKIICIGFIYLLGVFLR